MRRTLVLAVAGLCLNGCDNRAVQPLARPVAAQILRPEKTAPAPAVERVADPAPMPPMQTERATKESIRSAAIGLTKAQVRDLVGQLNEVSDGGLSGRDNWFYWHPPVYDEEVGKNVDIVRFTFVGDQVAEVGF